MIDYGGAIYVRTSFRGNGGICLDMNSTSGVVGREFEVRDSYARKSIEAFECDHFRERHVVKYSTKSSDTKLSGGYGPIEARTVEQVSGEFGETIYVGQFKVMRPQKSF